MGKLWMRRGGGAGQDGGKPDDARTIRQAVV